MNDITLIQFYCLSVPLLAVVLIHTLGRVYPILYETINAAVAVLTFALVVYLYSNLGEVPVDPLVLFEPFPGVAIALQAEPLGLLFALMASFLWIVTSIYSFGYMRGHGEINLARFYTFFAIAISSAIGVALAANGFTLFLFYEVLTLSTFPLVTHAGNEKAKRAGRIYLFLLLGTSVGMFLFALIWTWMITGSLDFRAGGVFDSSVGQTTLNVLLALYVFGIGKAALMPFHRWLPTAMVAPTPVSALLHAVAVVKAGVFAILKICIYIFGIDLLQQLTAHRVLAYVAAFTIVATAIIALRKDNLKARLAYSTVGQLSYIVLGALVANAAGVIGGGMHMLMHGFGKITLFFGAGAILVATHKTEISQMRGIGRRMPVTMTAFFIGCVAIIGAPPTGGMWSKWNLLLGTAHTSDWLLLAALIIGSLLSAAYLLPIVVRAFYLPQDNEDTTVKEAPTTIVIAMIISAAGCVILFFAPDFAFDLMNTIAGPE